MFRRAVAKYEKGHVLNDYNPHNAAKIAAQISRVCTVGLGRPLRANANVGELLALCRALADDKGLPRIRLIEDALKVSIDRLGDGELGLLARIEFRLNSQTARERFIKGRRFIAMQKLGVGEAALSRLERHMHLALAEDLIRRLGESEPLPS